MCQVTDPYLNVYRGIVPPLLGTIDFTPMLGFLALQYIADILDIGDDEEDLLSESTQSDDGPLLGGDIEVD